MTTVNVLSNLPIPLDMSNGTTRGVNVLQPGANTINFLVWRPFQAANFNLVNQLVAAGKLVMLDAGGV